MSRVRRAIDWIRAHANESIRTESLAAIAAMSVPAFHRHFKAATTMSPLQFQKALRLQEARRLLLADFDVAAAAYAVGYESASQFSREYSRLFGMPPSQTARQLGVPGSALYARDLDVPPRSEKKHSRTVEENR